MIKSPLTAVQFVYPMKLKVAQIEPELGVLLWLRLEAQEVDRNKARSLQQMTCNWLTSVEHAHLVEPRDHTLAASQQNELPMPEVRLGERNFASELMPWQMQMQTQGHLRTQLLRTNSLAWIAIQLVTLIRYLRLACKAISVQELSGVKEVFIGCQLSG
jgi:hypothetical protein